MNNIVKTVEINGTGGHIVDFSTTNTVHFDGKNHGRAGFLDSLRYARWGVRTGIADMEYAPYLQRASEAKPARFTGGGVRWAGDQKALRAERIPRRGPSSRH